MLSTAAGWFRRGPTAPAAAAPIDDTIYTAIDTAPRIPEGATCYFDPFDIQLRKKGAAVMSRYSNAVGAAPPPPAQEALVLAEGEEAPAQEWEATQQEGDASGGAGSDASALPLQPPADDDGALAERIKVERAKVDEMMEMMGESYPTTLQDRYKLELALLRFLRGRKGLVPKAVESYKEMMKWRADNNIDVLLDTPDKWEDAFQCICGHRNHGFGFNGQPVYIERTGLVRVGNLLKVMDDDHVVLRHIRHMEYTRRRMEYSSYLNQCNVEKCIMIHDLAHMSYTIEPSGIRIFKRTLNIDQNYYPETLHKMFIINAPMSFRAVWGVISPFVDPVTKTKIEIIGSAYQPRLLLQIPSTELPSYLGGLCKCKHDNGDGCVNNVRPYPPPSQEEVPRAWPALR